MEGEFTAEQIAEIRAKLPFGPPWWEHCETLAGSILMTPEQIQKIWAGIAHDWPRAYPKDHPRRYERIREILAGRHLKGELWQLNRRIRDLHRQLRPLSRRRRNIQQRLSQISK